MNKLSLFVLVIVLVIVGVLCLLCTHANAEDGNNIPDMTADVLSGRQDNCPTTLAIGLIIEKQVKGIPLLNVVPILNQSRLQAGVRGYTPMGEKFGKEGEVLISTDFIWNWD